MHVFYDVVQSDVLNWFVADLWLRKGRRREGAA